MSSMTPRNSVRRYLIERGVRSDLLGGGLTGLVERWTNIVDEIARGYQLTLDDYLNDMDVRDIIAGALTVADPQEREEIASALAHADRKLREVTKASPSLLEYPTDVPKPTSPPNLDRWWYARRPKNAGAALTRDLANLLSD
jgi:hypothetical protein